MIKYLKALFVTMLVSLLCGCSKENNETNQEGGEGQEQTTPIVILPSQNLSPTFDENGGSVSITFNTNADWVASVINTRAEGWCTVAPGSGAKGVNSITIKVAPNDTPDNRYAVVQITCGNYFQNIEVTQKQKDALTLTKNRFEVSKDGDLVEIEVKANVQISYIIDDNGKDWINYVGTRAMTTSVLSFKVAKNETSDKREATITLSNGNLSETVTIYQEGGESPSIIISKSKYTVGSAGETIQVDVSSNVDVEVVMPEVDWIQENTTRAMSTHTFYYEVKPNEEYEGRSAEIIFKNGANGLEERVQVNQTQKDAIVIAQRLYSLDNSGGTIEIPVSHNVQYSVSIDIPSLSYSEVPWIKEVNTRGLTTDYHTFEIAGNSKSDGREGYIIFKSADGNIEQEVKVCQSAAGELVIGQSEYVLGSEGGNFTVEIRSNVNFEVIDPNVSWLHRVKTKALTEYSLQYKVDPNSSYDSRQAEITVRNIDNGKKNKISVSQMQKDAIVLSKSEYEFGKEGGELDFDIRTNVDVDVAISYGARSWIEQVTTRGLQTKTLHFNIATCSDGESREGTITLKGGNVTQTIKVKQSAASTDELEKERAALIDLYNSTKGANWTTNTNWCSDKPLGEWYGVTTDADGHVIHIELSENNLIGKIPNSIGNLTNLVTLNLAGNQLSGSIPESIGNLANLEILGLGANQLIGSIPESISKLKKLESLGLAGNGLMGSIPESIGNLTNLRYIVLHGNQLSGTIPKTISNLLNLKELYLSDNKLTGSIPSTMGNLTKLVALFLQNNQLSGTIPYNIGSLTKLTYLYLNDNQLTGSIPESIGNLTSLTELWLDNNQLTGTIPESMCNLTALEYLYLQNNQLTGIIPAGIFALPNLLEFLYDEDKLSKENRLNVNNLSLVNIYQCYGSSWHHELKYQNVSNSASATIPPVSDNTYEAYFCYDESLDLREVVALADVVELKDLVENHGYDVEYIFSLPDIYMGLDQMTNQNKFVILDGSVIKVNTGLLSGGALKSAIGRTPVVMVKATMNQELVKSAYIKLMITEKEVITISEPIELEVGPIKLEYSEIDGATIIPLLWDRINVEVYEQLGLDASVFWDIYNDYSIVASNGAILTFNEPMANGTPVSTDIANLTFDPYKIQLGKDSASLTLIPETSYYKDVVIKFHYNITHSPSFPDLNPDYLLPSKQTVDGEEYEVVRVKGKLIDGVWALQAGVKEFCEDYLDGYEQPGNHNAIKFHIEGLVTEDGSLIPSSGYTNIGACLTDGTTDYAADYAGNQNVEIKLTTPLGSDETSRVYLMRMSQMMYNGHRCEKYFCVEFVRPFAVSVEDVVLKTLGTPDKVDISSKMKIYDLDGDVVFEKGKITEYGKLVFNLSDQMIEIVYDLPSLDNTWYNSDYAPKLFFDGSVLTWYNGASNLSSNKKTEYAVKVVIDSLCTIESMGRVTVLSTNNSAE